MEEEAEAAGGARRPSEAERREAERAAREQKAREAEERREDMREQMRRDRLERQRGGGGGGAGPPRSTVFELVLGDTQRPQAMCAGPSGPALGETSAMEVKTEQGLGMLGAQEDEAAVAAVRAAYPGARLLSEEEARQARDALQPRRRPAG